LGRRALGRRAALACCWSGKELLLLGIKVSWGPPWLSGWLAWAAKPKGLALRARCGAATAGAD